MFFCEIEFLVEAAIGSTLLLGETRIRAWVCNCELVFMCTDGFFLREVERLNDDFWLVFR